MLAPLNEPKFQELNVFHALMQPTLRLTFIAAAATLAISVAGLTTATAQKVAAAGDVAVEDLMKASDLPDIAIGPDDAKITIVEYSSLTCPHCADFSNLVLPSLKTKYIDTGKVRFISREFPLNNLAAAGAMLARCVDKDKAFTLIDTLFASQKTWAFGEGNPVPRLFDVAKQAGFTQETFDKCLTDQALLDKVNAIRTRGGDVFKVSSTPTFFINGKRLAGNNRLEDFDKVIQPLLDPK
jgi:protein-disulfide isomerase